MFMAIGTTAVVAALALGASFAYVDQGDGDTDQGPSAAEIDALGDDWAFFAGTLTFDGSPIGGSADSMEVVNGIVVRNDVGYKGQTLVTSDPRMSGIRTEWNNTHQSLQNTESSPPGTIWSNTATIESDGRTWTCRLDGAAVGELAAEGGWCEGAGGFEGLSAFIMFDIHDAADGYEDAGAFGYITNGDGPPAPEPYTE
jgi:hypothetical protein